MTVGFQILLPLLITLLLGPIAAPEPVTSTRVQASADSTTLILLGTGNPYPLPERQGPATAVVVGARVFLFDAGSGVMRQMKAAGLPISGPTALFITHLHSDHTLGYPDVIFTSWFMRRAWPLQVYGPHGLRRMTDNIMAAWQEDIEIRTEGLEHEVADWLRVDVHECSPGVVYDSGGVRVSAIPVKHGEWKEAYGFRIDTPDRSIVIGGDTAPSDEIVKASQDVDVLIHEVYPRSRVAPEKRPGGEDWPQYLKEYHTSDLELGQLAAKCRPKLLILSHIVAGAGAEEEIIRGIREGGYTGPIEIGKDLGRY
jgi:ribonuclease BN (tRNA processing enzyme)